MVWGMLMLTSSTKSILSTGATCLLFLDPSSDLRDQEERLATSLSFASCVARYLDAERCSYSPNALTG